MEARNIRAPALNALSTSYTTSISTYGQLQSALGTFRDAAQPLTGNAFNAYTATSSTASVAAATTSSTSTVGTYAVQVNQLASAQALSSAGQASETAAIGSGATTTLTFQFGTTTGATFTPNAGQVSPTVTITNNSLQGIASAINTADVGVTAGVNFDGTSYHLTVKGNASGASNSMSISATGDAAVAALVNYAPGGTQTMIQTVAAQDAQVAIDGITTSTPTNMLVGTLPGTTLTVAALGSTNITVAPDVARITGNAGNFVKAYNTLMSTLESLAQNDPSAGTAMMNVRNQLSKTLNSTQGALAGSPYTSPAQVGITTQADGTLALNKTSLQSALSTNLGNVAKIFTNNGQGIADTFVSQVQSQVGSGSWISAAQSSLNAGARSIDNSKSALSFALTTETQRLIDRYTNLNLSLARWQQTSSMFSNAPSATGTLNLFA
jgi:flagellar hook-associated protein 2